MSARLLRVAEAGAARLADALRLVAVEPLEERRQLRDDVADVDEFLVELRPALLAVPLEAVHLAGLALLLDHEPDGVLRPPRRVRHARRQQEDLPLPDRDVDDLPPVLHLQDY